MSGHAITATLYSTIAALAVVVQLVALRRGHFPTFGATITYLLRRRSTQLWMVVVWWWLGWHLVTMR